MPVGSFSPVDHEPPLVTVHRVRGGFPCRSRSTRGRPTSRRGSVRHRLSASQSLSAWASSRPSTVAPESTRKAPVANEDTKSTTTASARSVSTSVQVCTAATRSWARNTLTTRRPVPGSSCTMRSSRTPPSSPVVCSTWRRRAPIVESTWRNPPGNRPWSVVVSSTRGCRSAGSTGPGSGRSAGRKETSATGAESLPANRSRSASVAQSMTMTRAPLRSALEVLGVDVVQEATELGDLLLRVLVLLLLLVLVVQILEDPRLRDHRLGHEERRADPGGQCDGVGRAAVDGERAALRREAELCVEGAVLDPGHVDPVDRRADGGEQPLHEVVRERPRGFLAAHRDRDRGRLLRADPDRHQRPRALVAVERRQEHDGLHAGVDGETEHTDRDHYEPPGRRERLDGAPLARVGTFPGRRHDALDLVGRDGIAQSVAKKSVKGAVNQGRATLGALWEPRPIRSDRAPGTAAAI